MGFLIDILIGAASRIVTGELSAHVEPFARWVIGKAPDRLPADDRERFREEWLAHLEEVPGAVRKLWHAVGCHLGSAKVAGVMAEQSKRRETSKQVIRTVYKENVEINKYLKIHLGVGQGVTRFVLKVPHHGNRTVSPPITPQAPDTQTRDQS